MPGWPASRVGVGRWVGHEVGEVAQGWPCRPSWAVARSLSYILSVKKVIGGFEGVELSDLYFKGLFYLPGDL